VAGSGMSLSPEAQLLLLTAARSPSDSSLRQTVSGGIDWEKLCALVQYEKGASVLLRQLGRVGADAGGSGYRELRQLATISVMQMLQLEQLLHQTVDILADQKIEVALLKGAGLGYTAYSSFADRPMGDLDLLVRPRDATRAWSLLRKHGWVPDEAEVGAQRYVGHQHLPRLFRESGTFRLEIHASVLPQEHPFRFSTDTFWDRAQRVTANARAFTVPHPMHQLWHVCVHFAWCHAMKWGSWRTLRDVTAIIHAGGIDWTEFVNFARETRAASCCFWTLRLAQRLAGAAVPDEVLLSLRPPYPEFIVQRLERHLVSNLFPSESRCPSVWLANRLWEAAFSPRWSGHGAARPWDVAERWVAGSERPDSDHGFGDAVSRWLRQVAAGAAYLTQVSRFSMPVYQPNRTLRTAR
jgi:hypothetical protein